MSAPGQPIPTDPAQVTEQLYLAINAAAQAGAVTQTPGEMDQAAAAALKFAQALVILDPSLAQGGTPLEHDVAMKELEGRTQLAVTQAQGAASIRQEEIRAEATTKAAASAPTPTKRKSVSVRRDQHGRAQSYDVSES